MSYTYQVGDVVHIELDATCSNIAGRYGEVIEAHDDYLLVQFTHEDEPFSKPVHESMIDSLLVEAMSSRLIKELHVWDADTHFDIQAFKQGSCAIAVRHGEVDAFLAFCDILNITWVDGDKATSFNPYSQFNDIGPLGALGCAIRGMEPPSEYCIFATTHGGLAFMFSQVISNCIHDVE